MPLSSTSVWTCKYKRESIPLGSLQTPEDVANIAVWLVSPEADYITGVYVLTTGGQAIV